MEEEEVVVVEVVVVEDEDEEEGESHRKAVTALRRARAYGLLSLSAGSWSRGSCHRSSKVRWAEWRGSGSGFPPGFWGGDLTSRSARRGEEPGTTWTW